MESNDINVINKDNATDLIAQVIKGLIDVKVITVDGDTANVKIDVQELVKVINYVNDKAHRRSERVRA